MLQRCCYLLLISVLLSVSKLANAARPWSEVVGKRGGLGGGDGGAVGCKDESGNPVDWFVVLKYPNSANYAFTDSRTASLGIRKSPFTLDSQTEGAVAATLKDIYSSSDAGYLQYNDDWPDDHKHGTGGHAKGFFGFDSDGGFWLIHSVPRFPNFVSEGSYQGLPEEEYKYGQSMLCISTGLDGLDTAARQLLIGYAWTYGSSLPGELGTTMPNMQLLASSDRGDYGDSGSETIMTNAHNTFRTFYKSPKWGKYLYEDMVEPHYDANMLWETWMNGINPDPTFCRPDYDYNSINIRYVSVAGEVWKETQDHSKWGVADCGGSHAVCIGDINRQQSQNHRGGGTTCFQNYDLWGAFQDVVYKFDQC